MLSPGVPGLFTSIEASDPHELVRLIRGQLARRDAVSAFHNEMIFGEWAALDRRGFRIEPDSYRMQYSRAAVGGLWMSRIVSSRATQFTAPPPLADASYSLCVLERGAGRVILPGSDEPAIGNAATGLIYPGEPGTSAVTSDDSSHLTLRLPASLLRRKLEALLDGPRVATVAFQPVFDQTRGAGATIRRMVEYLFAELAQSDSLLANEIAMRSFEDHLAFALLLGLPHQYSVGLQRQRTATAPGNVKRAEAFMRANAALPLTIAEIADAAGCGVRALQIAFHRFRGTTPMRALRQARLEQARQEMLRPGRSQSLARIAALYGFSNPTRFARLFQRSYGLYPSEMLRSRHDLSIG